MRFLLILACMSLGGAFAQANEAQHMGVASCASSTCHGALSPWQDSTILSNEYVTWQQDDPHARAFETLRSAESRRIAANLGIGLAEKAPECLTCHADYVPKEQQGARYVLADGVGCEACHGGSEAWLELHTIAGTPRAKLEAAGLKPLHDPAGRAEVCLSCHYGNDDTFLTHRLYGAGHPRLSFELDTFSALQPAHYRVDADYKQRKPYFTNAQFWAIGQAVAVREVMDAVLAHAGTGGAWPEFSLYECQSCHRGLTQPQSQMRASVGVPLGVPRLRDDHLLMLRAAASVLAPKVAVALKEQGRALQQALAQGGDARAAAKTLRASVDALAQRLEAAPNSAQLQEMLALLAAGGVEGRYEDYAAAEQAVMGMSAILASLRAEKMMDSAKVEAISNALDKCYDVLKAFEGWSPPRFAAALKSVAEAV